MYPFAGKRPTLDMTGRHCEGRHKTQLPGILHISPVNPTSMFYVHTRLSGCPCSFLLDTGAAVTLLSTRTFERCQPLTPLQLWTQQQLVEVEGSLLHVKGTISLHIDFYGQSFKVPFIVINNLSEDAILGLDFLKQHSCCIDTGKKLLQFGSENFSVPLHSPQDSQVYGITTSVAAVLTETVYVPA